MKLYSKGRNKDAFLISHFTESRLGQFLAPSRKITGNLSGFPLKPAVCTNFQKLGVAQENWSKGYHQDKISIISDSIQVICHYLLRIILLIFIK